MQIQSMKPISYYLSEKENYEGAAGGRHMNESQHLVKGALTDSRQCLNEVDLN